MIELLRSPVGGRVVHVGVTERADGDVHPTRVRAAVLRDRQRSLTGVEWAMGRQVHGTAVWVADTSDGVGPEADVVVVDHQSRVEAIAMWAADCATAIFVTPDRLVGVHAGWRGLAAGVIDRAVDLATADGRPVEAVVTGPTISPCCYEFSPADLSAVAAGIGARPSDVEGVTTSGRVALDVDAAVGIALRRRGLDATVTTPGCTGCDPRWFSHRAGVDAERHALVGWWR